MFDQLVNGTSMKRALGLYLDGNIVQLAESSHDPEKDHFTIEHLCGHEEETLLESAERIHHPIFMDVFCVHYRDPNRIVDVVNRLLDRMQPGTRKTVGCMAGETVRFSHILCEPKEAARVQALGQLLSAIQNNSPLHYPMLFTYRCQAGVSEDGRDQILLSATHSSEIQAFLDLTSRMDLEVIALSNSQQALACTSRLLGDPGPGEAILISDIGRLRTHYIGLGHGRFLFSHCIPVGMVRDDIHMFRSIPFRMDALARLNSTLGSLILPPEMTPPPLFNPALSTPQLDCTRFATQVARYMIRAIEQAQQMEPPVRISRCILSGLPSRLPGFRKFLQVRSSNTLTRPESIRMPHVAFSDPDHKLRLGDFLVPVGATLRALGASATGLTATPLGMSPQALGKKVLVENLEPGAVYQVDGPFQIQ